MNKDITLPAYFDLPGCETCRFKQTSLGRVQGVGPLNAELCIVGEAPGRKEMKQGRPFAGQTGGGLNHYLRGIGLTRLDVRLENAIWCSPLEMVGCSAGCDEGRHPDGVCDNCHGTALEPVFNTKKDWKLGNPNPQQIVACWERHVQQALKRLPNVKLFVAMGAAALYALTRKTGITKHRGKVHNTELGPVLATFHPAYVMRRQTHKHLLYKDFERIPELMGWKPEKVRTPTAYVTEVQESVSDLLDAEELCVDLETDRNDSTKIRLASVSTEPKEARVVSPHQLRDVLARLPRVVGHNFGNFDAWSLYKTGMRVPPVIVDTLNISHYVNPSTPNDLATVQSEFADEPSEVFWKEEQHYAGDLGLVACRDTDYTYRSLVGMRKELKKQGRWDLVEENIVPLTFIAHEMRREGIKVNQDVLRAHAEDLEKQVRDLGQQMKSWGAPLPKKSKSGFPSPTGFADYIYNKLKLPRRTKDGRLTVDKSAITSLIKWAQKNGRAEAELLEAYQRGGELASQSRNYRKYEHWGSTIHAELILGRMETGSGGTVTGRLSYRNPSLHQVPKFVRRGFLPRSAHLFVEADVKTGEYLIAAYHASDWNILDAALNHGKDFHSITMKQLGVERKLAKNIAFSKFFGADAENSAYRYGIDPDKMAKMFDRLDELVPGWAPHCQQEVADAEEKGYVETAFGWRRYFDDFRLQEIINTRIQSDLALTVRYKVVDLWNALPDYARIVLTVHDSLLVETPIEKKDETLKIMREVLSRPTPQLPCPAIGHPDGIRFVWDYAVGYTWGDMEGL